MNRLQNARLYVEQAKEFASRVDDSFLKAWLNFIEGFVALGLGELDNVEAPLAKALDAFAAAKDVSGYMLVLDAFASLALRRGNRRRAATLSGAVAQLQATSGLGLILITRRVSGFDPSQLRTDPDLSDAWAAGTAMESDAIVVYALAGE